MARMVLFLIPFFIFYLKIAEAAPVVSPSESAYFHQKLARDAVKNKQWEKARDEAQAATAANPNSPANRDAWLLLGATEERLGNFPEAKDAYEKYLTLSPPPEKRQAVMLRYHEVEPKAEHYTRYKWGANSAGITLGFSPLFQTNMQSQLDSELKSAFDVGLRFGMFSFGYKRGRASVGAFQAPTSGTAGTSTESSTPYHTVAAGGAHIMESIYMQVNFELGQNTETKSIVFGIPLYFGATSNAVRLDSGTVYNNIAYDVATGLRVDFYTKSLISFDVSALYHLGIPFWDVRETSDSVGIKNLNGDIIKGSDSGFEIRLGIKILFGKTPPEQD